MKKLMIILITGAMSSSCVSDSIDITKIETPCGCAEEGIKILKKIIPYKYEIWSRKEADMKVFLKEKGIEEVFNQMVELKKKCRGELSFENIESDCSAKSEFEDLAKEMDKKYN
tara:strand:- start:251 stop:592 length:342 start_codon:yes stop_codon:yes gene_type:complete